MDMPPWAHTAQSQFNKLPFSHTTEIQLFNDGILNWNLNQLAVAIDKFVDVKRTNPFTGETRTFNYNHFFDANYGIMSTFVGNVSMCHFLNSVYNILFFRPNFTWSTRSSSSLS